MAKVKERTPKRTTKRPKREPLGIKEVYPNGMTREEYIDALRQHARYFARLFLQIYPNVLIQDEEHNEKVVTPSGF